MKAVAFWARFFLPLVIICAPFALCAVITESYWLAVCTVAAAIVCALVYLCGLHRIEFNAESKKQRAAFAFVLLLVILFSFFVCAVSINGEWLHEYPLKGSVDDYGCYPQMLDAFQKRQLHIDTDYDLTVLESLENPYDVNERRAATGERFGVIWDRAYFDGKLYSYFGIAPIIYLYYPVFVLTGCVLSDALASAILAAAAALFICLILFKLFKHTEKKPPFVLFLLGCVTLPCGAILWPTLTNANFYHIAVLSGILAVCAFFYFVLSAYYATAWRRKLYFALAGGSVAAIVASRPNMALYVAIALPLLVYIIIKRPFGTKSLLLDIASFCVPMLALGALIMLYNHARFGSPFDFGTAYQLTLADTSTYTFSFSLILPAIFHYFLHPPSVNRVFPFIHPAIRHLADYGVARLVYTDASVGAIFFPCCWGAIFVPTLKKHKIKAITAFVAILSVFAVAVFDMCFGGVHLRYAADIMFVLALLGVYLFITFLSGLNKNSRLYPIAFAVTVAIFAATVLINAPLCLDNERDMILKYHTGFFKLLMF